MKETVITNNKKIVFSVLIGILICIIINSMLGEKVAYNDGAGWDGLFYRNVIYNFNSEIFSHVYDSYRIQRILPFGVANIVFNTFNIVKTNSSLMTCIQIMNFFVIIISVFYFFKIIDELKLSLPVSIVGFAAIFFNYPILKLMGYYPFLTDTYALGMSIIQFYFFITKRKALLVIFSIVGAFIWPTLFLTGLILAFFPDKKFVLSEDLDRYEKGVLCIVKTIMIAGLPLLFSWIFIFKRSMLFKYYSGAQYSNIVTLIAALLCISLYIYLLLKPVKISIFKNINIFVRNFEIRNLVLFVLLYLGIKFVINYLSNGSSLVSLSIMLKGRLLVPPTVDPFVFLVCNFMYYGFIVFFIIFYWEEVLKIYAEYGYSFFITISLGFLMSLNTESRHLISFIPFIIFPLLKLLSDRENSKISLNFSIVFSFLSLALSRFWYKINVPGIEKAFIDPFENRIGSYQDFPAQRYFMAQGPWMSHEMYYIFLGIFVISLSVFILYFKHDRVKY